MIMKTLFLFLIDSIHTTFLNTQSDFLCNNTELTINCFCDYLLLEDCQINNKACCDSLPVRSDGNLDCLLSLVATDTKGLKKQFAKL